MLRENLQTLLYTPMEPTLSSMGVGNGRVPFYGPIKAYGHSWASTDSQAHTLSGTAIDLLAAVDIQRGAGHAQAYDRAAVACYRLMGLPEPPEPDPGRQALAYRGLLHLVCDPRNFNQTQNGDLMAALNYRTELQHPNSGPPGCLVALDRVRVRKLKTFLEKLELELPFDARNPALVTAYYLEPGIISHLVLKRLWTGREQVVELFDSRLSLSSLPWSGLHRAEKPLTGSRTRVLDADYGRLNGEGLSQLVCWSLTGSGDRVPDPECYWSVSEPQDLEAGLWATRGLNLPFFAENRLVESRELVCNRILTLTESDSLPASARSLLQADGPRPHTLQQVLDELRARARYRAARAVEAQFGQGVLVHGPKSDILLTDKGLVYRETEGAGTLITNFTMRGQRVVVFPDRERDQVEFEIQCQGQKSRLLVPEDLLGTGAKFADYLQRRPTDPDCRPPRVLDPGRMAPVLHWARTQISDLPIVQGQSGLGWNGVRDRFASADWVASPGARERERPWSPDTPEFQCYARGLVRAQPHTQLPQTVCDILSTVMAQIQRHYLGYTNQVLEVLNNGANRRTLEILFRALGQFRALDGVTNNRQRPAPNLNGYPAWILGRVRGDQPLWALGDTGVDWGPVPDRDLEMGAEMLAACLESGVETLLSGGSRLQEPVRRVLHRAALVEEGAQLIRQTMGLSVWPQSEPGYPNLERLLSGMDREQAARAWMLDLRDQKLYLVRSACTGVRDTWEDVLAELSTLVKGLKHCPVGAVMDPVSGQHFLTQYHNGDPPLGMMSMDWALAEEA
jgi:hypothetical protein